MENCKHFVSADIHGENKRQSEGGGCVCVGGCYYSPGSTLRDRDDQGTNSQQDFTGDNSTL